MMGALSLLAAASQQGARMLHSGNSSFSDRLNICLCPWFRPILGTERAVKKLMQLMPHPRSTGKSSTKPTSWMPTAVRHGRMLFVLRLLLP